MRGTLLCSVLSKPRGLDLSVKSQAVTEHVTNALVLKDGVQCSEAGFHIFRFLQGETVDEARQDIRI